jgi:uncharacterized membrane protein
MMLFTTSAQLRYERKWDLSDTTKRTIAKTISWRITGTLSTFLISYIMLGSIAVASSIAIVQLIANTILYYFHERSWNLIDWGRKG